MFEYRGDGVAFSLLGLEVRWYAVFIVTGMALATYLASKLMEKEGRDGDIIYDLALLALPTAVIGARIWYVIFEADRFNDFWSIINIRSGGLAIQGGVMAAMVISYLFSKKNKISFLMLLDCIAPFLPLAQSIGRWGNFMNNEAYGYPLDAPWAVIIDGVGHHPTFFYESVGDFLIFLFLLLYIYKYSRKRGQTTMLYFVLYGILRYVVEGFRMDSLYIGSLRVAQILGLLGAFIGFIFFIIISKKGEDRRPFLEKN